MLLLCRVRLGCDKGLEHKALGVATHLVLEKSQVHNSRVKICTFLESPTSVFALCGHFTDKGTGNC